MESYLVQHRQLTLTLSQLFVTWCLWITLKAYISTIIYIYVFSPHQRALCLDSILLTLPTFDFIFILFPTPYLPRFCLAFRSILIAVIHGRILRDFQKPLPLKRRFPTFHYRTSSFCYHPFFFIRTLKTIGNYWKVNSYFLLPGNDHEPPSWNATCYPLGHQ